MINTIFDYINKVIRGEKIRVAGCTAQWKKVEELKPGIKIAIEENGGLDWDEVVSIKKVGIERVYDIEVEGTHNFVAGHWIKKKTIDDRKIEDETSTLNPLLGVQPVYRLTTEDGREIRTTGNHPYLVRGFSHNQNSQENSNQNQSKSNLDISAGVENIKFTHNSDLSNLKQIPKQNIAREISPVKTQYKSGFEKLTKFGVINAAVNQAADKLTDNPDKDLTAAFLSLRDNFINTNLSKENSFVKRNKGVWTKVIYLEEGDEIAVSDENYQDIKWIKIQKIEELPAEQVYDIEEEYFFGGIIAHNTYISGSVGIGTTSSYAGASLLIEGGNVGIGIGATAPRQRLDVGSGQIIAEAFLDNSNSSYYLDPAGSPTSLAVLGNVGIGTTGPLFPLDVNGKIGISGTQVVYLPNQTNFTGTLIIGDGGASLTHVSGGDGFYNTFVGINVGSSNTTGYGNATMGFMAFYSNTTGRDNSALGHRALYSNTTGYYNTAMGKNALYSNTTGYGNSAVGIDSLYSNTTGYYNTAMGDDALYLNTEGSNNSALGLSALNSNTTGSDNVAVGTNTLYYTQTGLKNTAIGREAGSGVSSNSFSNNSLFGYRAGYALSTGSNNLLLGYQVGDNLTTGANNIIVGYDIDAPSATSNQMLNIGNLIFATGLNGTGTTLSSGNVGIGTTSPSALLHLGIGSTAVVGQKIVLAAGATANAFEVNTSTGVGGNLVVMQSNGNVGIGTTNPSAAKLVINSSTSAGIRIQSTSQPYQLSFDGAGGSGTVFGIGSFEGSVLSIWGNSSNRIATFTSGGNVGIGTTGPGAKLVVNAGSLQVIGTRVAPTSGIGIEMGYNGTYSDILSYNRDTPGYKGLNLNDNMYVSGGSSGNVGIGTTSPSVALHTVGNARFTAIGSGTYSNVVNQTSDGTLTTATSDIRFKKDILTIDNALDKVMQLRGVTFNWTDPGNPKRMTGMIAQEVLDVMPELVTKNPTDGYYGLLYGETSGLLIEAIKELSSSAASNAAVASGQQSQLTTYNLQLTTLSNSLSLTSSGDIQILGATYDGLLDKEQMRQNNSISLINQAGEAITRIGAFAEIVSGKIKAGLVDTTNLITDNLVAGKAVINELTTNNLQLTNKIVSPVVETENLLAKKATINDLSVLNNLDAGNVGIGQLTVSDVSSLSDLSVSKNATISGELTAKTGKFGEILADKIRADLIEGLDAKIASIAGQLNNNSINQLPNNSITSYPEATNSALLASINSTPLTTNSYLDISSLDTSTLMVRDLLSVIGTAIMTNLKVTNNMVIDNNLILTSNSISTLGCPDMSRPGLYNGRPGLDACSSTLYLQPSGFGAINMLAGKFTVDEKGNVAIAGNLDVAGTITTKDLKVKDSLFANMLRPIGQDLSIQLNDATDSGQIKNSKFKIKNSLGNEVASVDASGSATFKKLNIASSEATPSSTGFNQLINPQVSTNATAGKAILPANTEELVINNQNITKDSLIYITPTSDTQNKVLYIKNKALGSKPYFTIGIDSSIGKDIEFNWWIIN